MYYGDKAAQDKAIMARVNMLRAAANIFPYLRKIVESFDGKVYNCRLEKALEEDGNYWICKLNRNDRYGSVLSIQFSTPDKNYGGSMGYWAVVNVNLGCPTDKAPKWDGKRIPAALLIENARELRERHLKEAADLESMIDRAPELEKQLTYFKNQIEKIVNTIPYTARDIYNLGYSVRNY